MGEMRQQWKIKDVSDKLDAIAGTGTATSSVSGAYSEERMIDAIYGICLDVATKAKNDHTYHNQKGELESSIGIVVLKNRTEIKRWELLASSGSDPAIGLRDLNASLESQVIGKDSLPNGTPIPNEGIIGIVMAGAPYAGYVEMKGRTVLHSFVPEPSYVFSILKSVMA